MNMDKHMVTQKKVLAICGSTRRQSANLQLLQLMAQMDENLKIEIVNDLEVLPHYNPDNDKEGMKIPYSIQSLREQIAIADGILICTPEYVFSLPGSLKNMLDWMVSTTVFSGKPVALITASALGEKAHESLQLIMKTLSAEVKPCAQLLISGIRSKIDHVKGLTDPETEGEIKQLLSCFYEHLAE